MRENIRLLEDRVRRVIARLDELKAERRELSQRVQELQRALAAERRDSGVARPPHPGGWERERAAIVGALRETVAELRGD